MKTHGGATLSDVAETDDFLHPPADGPLEIGFDLADLASLDSAELHVKHPGTGLPLGWVWMFAGPGHPQTLALNDTLGKKDRAEIFQREKAMMLNRDPKERSNKELIAENALRWGGRVLDWNPVKLNGQLLEFSTAKAVEVLGDPHYGWLYMQVLQFLQDEKSFLRY